MKVLITGVNGVVGKNLFHLLSLKESFDVWGTGRQDDNKTNYIKVDLIDRDSVISHLSQQKFDYVIHCAANLSMSEPSYDTVRNNTVSTTNVVEACLLSGVKKLYHTSSVPIIGSIQELPIKETHLDNPVTSYHLSKLHSEQIIEQYCKGKIDYINMRISSPIGKGMPQRSLFPIFMNKIRNGEDVTLVGSSTRSQNFLDIRDLAEFIYTSSQVNGVSGTYHIAAESHYTTLELAQEMITVFGSKSKIIDNTQQDATTLDIWDISIDKVKSHFNFEPKYTLSETIYWSEEL